MTCACDGNLLYSIALEWALLKVTLLKVFVSARRHVGYKFVLYLVF
jgi:hypothetical protein